MYDYHLHSHFSGDCQEKMEDIIKSAIAKGGKHICFTDHLDYDYPDTEIQFEFDPEGFESRFNELKEQYGDQIHIQKGIELGIQPHIIDQCEAFLEKFKPEFVLCSFHVAEKLDMYNGDYYKGKTSEEAWDICLDEILLTLKSFKNYSVVGHLDILKRYDDKVRTVPFAYYKDKMAAVLKQIIEDDRGIEVNMSGLRSELKETLPSRPIIELYYELGGKYITIGSDSHNKNDLYSHFYEVLEMLKSIGFESYTIYDQRKPIQMSIEKALNNKSS